MSRATNAHDRRPRVFAAGATCLGLVVGVVVALATTELAVRWFAPQVPYIYGLSYNWWRWDPDLGAVLRPSHRTVYVQPEFRTAVVTNSLGFRDREIALAKAPGITRILCVGDSFTFGFGVEADETWPKVLERELNGSGNQRVEVVNAGGASGFSPTGYYLFIRRYLDVLKPDIVIVGFTAHNDLPDEQQIQWTDVDGDGLPVHAHHTTTEIVNAAGMRVAKNGGIPWRYRMPLFNRSHVARLIGRLVADREKTEGHPQSRSYLKDYPADLDQVRKRTIRLLEGLDRLLNVHRVPLIVLMIPSLPQIEPLDDPVNLGYVPPGFRPDDMDFDNPQRELLPALAQTRIAVVDPRDELRAAARAGGHLYYRHDGHWTAEGHTVAGKMLAQFVAARRVLSSPVAQNVMGAAKPIQ